MGGMTPADPDGTARSPGPRGLSRPAIIAAAIALMEETGEPGFTLRKLGARIGCDPMTLLYHFKTKDGLLRAMADGLTAQITPVDGSQPWDARLRAHAHQYRALALGHPHTFGLMQRFLNTGVSDFAHIEMVHRALAEAGIADAVAPSVCLAWYAGVIGLCMGEIGGLIRAATESDLQEIARLPQDAFPRLRTLADGYRRIQAGKVFETANDMLIHAVRAMAQDRRPTSGA